MTSQQGMGSIHGRIQVNNEKQITIDWWPQPRQLVCLKACGLSYPFDGTPYHPAIADIIGYGGAAGGGKTDTDLSVAISGATTYPGLNIGYFRRQFPQLEGPGGAIMRSREMIGHCAKYNEQKKRWTFPSRYNNHGALVSSILQFCHCSTPADVYSYQSLQFDIIIIDEATQFEKDMIKYLLTRNRATVDYPTFKPFALLSTNPGNVGHTYFKDEFVELGPPEIVNIYINESKKPERHMFIPSKLTDNKILVDRDPGYADRLGSTEINRKVLLEGDWNVFAGQGFSELSRAVHLIDPFAIPPHWKVFGALDWGFNHPFSFGIFAVDDDGIVYLVGYVSDRLKQYFEVAKLMIKAAEPVGGLKRLAYIVGGHDLWAAAKKDGGPTLAQKFASLATDEKTKHMGLPNIHITKASIDRIQGSHQVRDFIAWKETQVDEQGNPKDGEPHFYIFSSFQRVYNTLARMIFDTDGPNPEDIKKVDADDNGEGGDDDYDMTRYGLMSRPRPNIQKPKTPPQNSVLALVKKAEQQRQLAREYVGYSQ